MARAVSSFSRSTLSRNEDRRLRRADMLDRIADTNHGRACADHLFEDICRCPRCTNGLLRLHLQFGNPTGSPQNTLQEHEIERFVQHIPAHTDGTHGQRAFAVSGTHDRLVVATGLFELSKEPQAFFGRRRRGQTKVSNTMCGLCLRTAFNPSAASIGYAEFKLIIERRTQQRDDAFIVFDNQ